MEDLPLQTGEEAEQTVNKIFELLESLEDQEAAKDWVAQCINDLVSTDEPFVVKGIRFLRIRAFEKPEKPETAGGDEGTT